MVDFHESMSGYIAREEGKSYSVDGTEVMMGMKTHLESSAVSSMEMSNSLSLCRRLHFVAVKERCPGNQECWSSRAQPFSTV